MGWFSRRCPDAGVGQGMAGRNWPPLDSWCFPSFRFGLFIPHTRLLLHRLFGCNVSIYTRMVIFSTSLAVLTSRGRLLNVPPMGGFRYFAFKNGERLEWPSCCPVLPRGAAESSWGGPLWCPVIPDDGLIPRLVQRGEQFVTSFCCTTYPGRRR